MAEQQPDPIDDFDSIFAELAKTGGETAKTEESTPDGAETQAGSEENTQAAAETEKTDDKPVENVEKPAEEQSADAQDAASDAGDGSTDAKPDVVEPPAERKLVDEDDEVLRRLAALVKEQKETQKAAPEPEKIEQPEAPLYSEDEKKFLSDYEKDWPDVAKAESLKRRAEYRELVNYVFTEVAKVLRPQIETVQAISEMTHLQQLQTQVSDYDDVRDKVIDWAEKQPTYLRAAYKHVIEEGTVDEVADLIDRYKRDNGASVAPAAPKPAPKKVETELPSATKQAAAALAPVSSKRSAVIAGDDPNDFEAAFQSFASKL